MRLTITACFGLVACVDAADEPIELATATSEIASPDAVVQRAECTEADVPEANLQRFRTALATDLLPRARTVANSPAFRECLRNVIVNGNVTLRLNRWQHPGGSPSVFGPYVPREGDFGYYATNSLPLTRMRDQFADRIAIEATTPNPLRIYCQKAGGGWANGPSPARDLATAEDMSISKDFFNEHPGPTGTTTNRGFRSFTAAVIWHELMHERGYWHGNDSPLESLYNNRVPAIAGACMDETFNRTEQNCGLTACPGGFSAMLSFNGDGGSCACVRDPGASFTPQLVDSWTFGKGGLIKFALDGSGQAYLLGSSPTGTAVFRRDGHNWTQLALADDMTAGGDAVLFKQKSPVLYAPPNWWLAPRVGGWSSTPSVTGETMTLDAFGRMVRVAGGQVSRKQGSGSWVGFGAAVAAVAGGELIYKQTSDGLAWRLDDGATPAWHSLGYVSGALTVDAYGTVYNQAPDQSLWRNRGTWWEWIGGPDDQIGAGTSFFTHSPVDGFVYRRAADNGWYRVAPCTSFAAGGRSLLCRRGNTLELFEY